MNNCFFPILVLISFFTVLLVDSLTPAFVGDGLFSAIAQLPPQEIRGVWMTNNDFDTLKNRAKVQEPHILHKRVNTETLRFQ